MGFIMLDVGVHITYAEIVVFLLLYHSCVFSIANKLNQYPVIDVMQVV